MNASFEYAGGRRLRRTDNELGFVCTGAGGSEQSQRECAGGDEKVAAAAAAEATKRNWQGMCVSVVGPSGDLVYFEKHDNCQFASISISQHKARTAARYRRPTVVFERLLGKGAFFSYLPTLDDVIASRGGNPLMVGGKVIGAIGVSGGSGSQDDVISNAGVAALK
jgi:glc operon protein GlcG